MQGQARLDALGITPDNSSVRGRLAIEASFSQTYSLFSVDDNGDIRIRFCDLHGDAEQYVKGSRLVQYEVIRKADPAGGPKYISPKGAGNRLFIPPRIVEAYRDQRTIRTLYVTEGEFKAMAGSLHGLDIVGIRGVHNIKEKESGRLLGELPALLTRCNVANVVILFDADATQYQYAEDRDTTQRLFSFYYALKGLRQKLRERFPELTIYYSQIRPDLPDGPKGLDDLLLTLRGREAEVVRDLNLLTEGQTWSTCTEITELNYGKLRSIFGVRNVDEFYTRHAVQIGDREFWYGGGRYVYDTDKEKVTVVKLAEAYDYIRVGTDYFKRIQRADERGLLEDALVPWRKGEISQDHGRDMLNQVDKYDSFCNVPANDHTYQQVIGSNYNLYFPCKHQPEPGEFPTIERYLRHLFDNQYQSKYTVALEYLRMLYLQPAHKLPILCLVSRTKETGKSTFFWLLREMFNENVVVVRNEDIGGRFNMHFAGKLAICIDEGFIDKNTTYKKLQSLSTSPRILLEGKGMDAREVPFIGKFLLTSNDEADFIRMDSDEIRFFIVKVPQISKKDPELLEKMRDEIPAFLYHLRGLKPLYDKPQTRMWFRVEDLETDALAKVRANTGTLLEKSLKEVLRDVFAETQQPELCFTRKEIMELLATNSNRNHQPAEVTNILENKWELEPTANALRYDFWEVLRHDDGSITPNSVKRTGRYYRIPASKVLNPTELAALEQSTPFNQIPF